MLLCDSSSLSRKKHLGVSITDWGITHKSPKASKAWCLADRSHQLPTMALWMYGFLVVSAELSGQNATVHGRNLEEIVDCGVCKAVPLSTCKYCHEGSSSSSQPRRRSSGGSSPYLFQPIGRRPGTAPVPSQVDG